MESTLARLGYTMTEQLASNGAQWVVRATGPLGHVVIKRLRDDLQASAHEAAALAVLGDVGSARLLAQPEPGILILEDVGAYTLAHLPDQGLSFAPAVGELLAGLHSVEATSFPSLSGHLLTDFTELIQDNHLLPVGLRRAAADALVALSASAECVLVHGDAWPPNVVVSGARLAAIDPYGFAGPAAYDLGYYATASSTSDTGAVLRGLLAGYGSTPPLLAESCVFALSCHLGYRLLAPEPEQTITPQMLATAEAMMRLGPQRWLASVS